MNFKKKKTKDGFIYFTHKYFEHPKIVYGFFSKIDFLDNTENLNLLCDNEQINRVIFNLIKNSIESIQEKALKSAYFDKKINIEIKRINNYIAINIFDNGIGFSKKVTKEIIKPYYTTKEKGSGLGLSIVNKIINDHNGNIEFNSDTTGTNIIINLPIK